MRCQKYPNASGRILSVISHDQLHWGKKRFTLAKKVYNRWSLTLIGHPYSSARIQTNPYQLKGWIRTKRAWNGGKKSWTTIESRSKFPRRTYKIETSNNYRGIIENKGVGIFNNNQHFGFFCYSKKQTIFLLIFFLSLVCFTPFEENEDIYMVVESHVTRQSLTQSPADQKGRGFCLRDWVLFAGYQSQ